MKTEEAIFRLQIIDNCLQRQNDYSEREHDAVMMAIEALKEPDTTFELYNDADFSGGGYLLCTKCRRKFSFGAYHILEYDHYCPGCGRRIIRQYDSDDTVEELKKEVK